MNDRVAIVTGAGKRLGKQIALALGESGYNVLVNYNQSRRGAAEAVKRIRKSGMRALAVKADISDKEQVGRLVETAISEFGRIDLLVNNSAIFIESTLFDITETLWNKTIDINLKGTFLCSQVVSLYMMKQKSGRIINIASLGGIQSWKKHIPYSVSKAGVIMLTRCLAKALAPHILVNAIAPGSIIMGKEDPDIQQVRKDAILLRRYGTPADVISLVLYLANAAKYITGQTFVVDGGRSV